MYRAEWGVDLGAPDCFSDDPLWNAFKLGRWLVAARSARIQRLLVDTTNGTLTQDHIRLDSGFDQEIRIIEISFDDVDSRVQILQPLGRRILSHERGDWKLLVSFDDCVEEIASNVASCTGPVAS